VVVEPPAVVVEPPAVVVEPPTVVVEPPTVVVDPPAVVVELPSVAVEPSSDVAVTALEAVAVSVATLLSADPVTVEESLAVVVSVSIHSHAVWFSFSTLPPSQTHARVFQSNL